MGRYLDAEWGGVAAAAVEKFQHRDGPNNLQGSECRLSLWSVIFRSTAKTLAYANEIAFAL